MVVLLINLQKRQQTIGAEYVFVTEELFCIINFYSLFRGCIIQAHLSILYGSHNSEQASEHNLYLSHGRWSPSLLRKPDLILTKGLGYANVTLRLLW